MEFLKGQRRCSIRPYISVVKDLPILVTAILGDVDLIITGDKDFFALDIEKPEIVSAKDFIERF
jgi:predicted nucleic acid-binding protein